MHSLQWGVALYLMSAVMLVLFSNLACDSNPHTTEVLFCPVVRTVQQVCIPVVKGAWTFQAGLLLVIRQGIGEPFDHQASPLLLSEKKLNKRAAAKENGSDRIELCALKYWCFLKTRAHPLFRMMIYFFKRVFIR